MSTYGFGGDPRDDTPSTSHPTTGTGLGDTNTGTGTGGSYDPRSDTPSTSHPTTSTGLGSTSPTSPTGTTGSGTGGQGSGTGGGSYNAPGGYSPVGGISSGGTGGGTGTTGGTPTGGPYSGPGPSPNVGGGTVGGGLNVGGGTLGNLATGIAPTARDLSRTFAGGLGGALGLGVPALSTPTGYVPSIVGRSPATAPPTPTSTGFVPDIGRIPDRMPSVRALDALNWARSRIVENEFRTTPTDLTPYDKVFGNKVPKAGPITGKTLDEVIAIQDTMGTTPIGGFQINAKTLKEVKAKLGLPGSTVMDIPMQQKFADYLVRNDMQIATDKKTGVVDINRFATELSKTWASLAGPDGKGHYDKGRHPQKAFNTAADTLAMARAFADAFAPASTAATATDVPTPRPDIDPTTTKSIGANELGGGPAADALSGFKPDLGKRPDQLLGIDKYLTRPQTPVPTAPIQNMVRPEYVPPTPTNAVRPGFIDTAAAAPRHDLDISARIDPNLLGNRPQATLAPSGLGTGLPNAMPYQGDYNAFNPVAAVPAETFPQRWQPTVAARVGAPSGLPAAAPADARAAQLGAAAARGAVTGLGTAVQFPSATPPTPRDSYVQDLTSPDTAPMTPASAPAPTARPEQLYDAVAGRITRQGKEWSFDEFGRMSPAMQQTISNLGKLTTGPLNFKSTFRDEASNLAAGGAKHSQHLKANAVDDDISGMTDEQKAQRVADWRAAGAKRIGAYPGQKGLHVDMLDVAPDESLDVKAMYDTHYNQTDKPTKEWLAGKPSWFKDGLTRSIDRTAVAGETTGYPNPPGQTQADTTEDPGETAATVPDTTQGDVAPDTTAPKSTTDASVYGGKPVPVPGQKYPDQPMTDTEKLLGTGLGLGLSFLGPAGMMVGGVNLLSELVTGRSIIDHIIAGDKNYTQPGGAQSPGGDRGGGREPTMGSSGIGTTISQTPVVAPGPTTTPTTTTETFEDKYIDNTRRPTPEQKWDWTSSKYQGVV